MKLIGLTGGVATGKTLVSNYLRSLKIPVVDADILARQVVLPGTYGLRAIVQVFGSEVLEGKELNRSSLRRKIFNDESARYTLERITHPLINWCGQREIQILREKNIVLAFYDAALIFEKNLGGQFDAIVVVTCSLATQLKRLMDRDKIQEEAAKKILDSQWPLEKKISLANFVINNDMSTEDTFLQVDMLLEKLS